MTSMRGRGRGARGGAVDSSSRRGSWRGGPPGSAGYSRGGGAARSEFPRRPSTGSATGVGAGGPPATGARKGDDKGKGGFQLTAPLTAGFQTDMDISAGARGAERELRPWVPEDANGAGAGANGARPPADSRDTITFGGALSTVPWDQFETNERLFGAKTDYDEEFYTTKLDRNAATYKKRERDADRIASEILSKTSSNAHIAEERGHATPGDKDEEEKYSGVARNPNAYVPPGARKGPAPVLPRKETEKTEAVKETPKDAKDAPKSNGPAEPVAIPVPPPQHQSSATSAPSPPPIQTQRASADPAIDPAIASLGPAPSMTRSTSAVPPQANGEGAPGPLSIPPIGAVVNKAREFVESERERVAQRKQSMAKNERANVLADLKSWQAKFRVPLPIPKDILPILAKDEQKQKDIEARAEKEREEGTKASKSPSPASKVLSPESATSSKLPASKKIPMKIPEIPPFRKKVPPAVPVPETAAQNIAMVTSPTPSNASLASGAAAKLNPKASAFVFKPTAAAFKPGGSGPTSAVTSPQPAAAKLPGPSTPKNPFYRDGPPKRIVVNPRDDFNPFKHGQVPQAASVSPQWPYTGRRSSVAFGGPPMHQMNAGFDEDPTSPHMGPPPMMQGGVPPNLMNFYRYQPGMPPNVPGGMPGMMFSPGPGFIPPQMGSPHHGGPPQPGQMGPNGMPMYFSNGMPNQHFIPPQMHFHPNGPGRPGVGVPGSPMFYGQQMGQGAPPMQQQMSFSGQGQGQGQPTPPQPHFQQPLPQQPGYESPAA